MPAPEKLTEADVKLIRRRARKLLERERRGNALAQVLSRCRLSTYAERLQTPKSLSGRALAEASGLVRLCSPDGTVCSWRERAEVKTLLDAGWLLA